MFLEEQPGDQETAEYEETQDAERAGNERKFSFKAKVIEDHEEDADGANPVKGGDGREMEPRVQTRKGASGGRLERVLRNNSHNRVLRTQRRGSIG